MQGRPSSIFTCTSSADAVWPGRPDNQADKPIPGPAVQRVMPLDLLWSDLRLAARNAVKRPGFTLLVVMTLALGIGVNSAVFALLDRVLLRPLPYREPDRLVFVWQTLPSQNVTELEPTPFDYDAWHTLRGLSALAMVRSDTFTLTGSDTPERVKGSRVTSSLMPLLGIGPWLGRSFTPAEDRDDTAAVAI